MPASFRLLVLVLGLGLCASCSRAPDLIGIDNPDRPAASVKAASRQKIFVATTRESSEAEGVFYSGARAPDLGFASVVVSIPPNHATGVIERASELPPDPDREFAVIQPVVYSGDTAFVADINRSLAALPRRDRSVLLFVHGYNNTMSDSILRLAQFVEDSGFTGVPVLFSWASAAKTTHYVYDLNSALTARPRLYEAVAALAETKATGFDIFAHSMGAFLTMETFVMASQRGQMAHRHRLKNVMLAAPDIDLDLFRSQLVQLPKDSRNFFILMSDDDNALSFSRRISGGVERVGSANIEELAALGVTVIDLSKVGDSSSGAHSKFAGSPEVVQLIGTSLQSDHFRSSPKTALVEVLAGVPVLNVLVD